MVQFLILLSEIHGMKIYLSLIGALLMIVSSISSCKNKRTRTCHLVDIGEQDTVGFYKQDGLFNKYAERECEAEIDHRDTLDEYIGNIYWCECDVTRK